MRHHERQPSASTQQRSIRSATSINKLSIFNEFLTFGRLRRAPDMMISSYQRRKNHVASKASFTYVPSGTSLTMHEQIERIESVKEQDIVHWFHNFESISTLCNWNEVTRFAALKALVAIPLQPLISRCTNVNEITTTLLLAKYPPEDAFKYVKEISTIQQDDFPRIYEYFTQIQTKVSILGYCKIGLITKSKIKWKRFSTRTYPQIRKLNSPDKVSIPWVML
jgi:hypothetical protein